MFCLPADFEDISGITNLHRSFEAGMARTQVIIATPIWSFSLIQQARGHQGFLSVLNADASAEHICLSPKSVFLDRGGVSVLPACHGSDLGGFGRFGNDPPRPISIS